MLVEAVENRTRDDKDLGVVVDKRITLDRHGEVIGEKPLRQILTSWDRLQRLLRETIDARRYHLGHTFERVEQARVLRGGSWYSGASNCRAAYRFIRPESRNYDVGFRVVCVPAGTQ